jgi:HSP20 family protein
MKTIVRTRPNQWNTLPNMFDEILNDWSQGSAEKQNHIATNVIESDKAFLLELIAPGFEKSDFNISLEHDVLSIMINKELSHDEVKEKYNRKEYAFSNFKRTFNLPENTIDTGIIEARYEAGVLRLSLPKKEEAQPQPAKVISIS